MAHMLLIPLALGLASAESQLVLKRPDGTQCGIAAASDPATGAIVLNSTCPIVTPELSTSVAATKTYTFDANSPGDSDLPCGGSSVITSAPPGATMTLTRFEATRNYAKGYICHPVPDCGECTASDPAAVSVGGLEPSRTYAWEYYTYCGASDTCQAGQLSVNGGGLIAYESAGASASNSWPAGQASPNRASVSGTTVVSAAGEFIMHLVGHRVTFSKLVLAPPPSALVPALKAELAALRPLVAEVT